MLETLANKAPAIVFYCFAVFFSFLGLLFIWIPFIGLPILGIGYCSYLIAGIAKRKARELEVRRQLGG